MMTSRFPIPPPNRSVFNDIIVWHEGSTYAWWQLGRPHRSLTYRCVGTMSTVRTGTLRVALFQAGEPYLNSTSRVNFRITKPRGFDRQNERTKALKGTSYTSQFWPRFKSKVALSKHQTWRCFDEVTEQLCSPWWQPVLLRRPMRSAQNVSISMSIDPSLLFGVLGLVGKMIVAKIPFVRRFHTIIKYWTLLMGILNKSPRIHQFNQCSFGRWPTTEILCHPKVCDVFDRFTLPFPFIVLYLLEIVGLRSMCIPCRCCLLAPMLREFPFHTDFAFSRYPKITLSFPTIYELASSVMGSYLTCHNHQMLECSPELNSVCTFPHH